MPEKADSSPSGNSRTLLVGILAVIILLPFGYSIVHCVVGQDAGAADGRAFLDLTDATEMSDRCVIKDRNLEGSETADRKAALEYVRRHHWEVLRGIREKVVRYGEREYIEVDGKPLEVGGKRLQLGLGSCKACHTSRKRFCDKCHHQVSLTPDCFGCHYYPE